ncbi:MAG: creatininase family protein [Myxococcales bacterium]|nr:creatininase family protein [Myxococcales bacterium]
MAELTWPEARDAAAAGAIALVPIGSTEAHGPHLPLATDVLLSEELARRSVLALRLAGRPSLIAPSIGYAVTEFAAPFGGTVSIRPATATALYADVCAGLQARGFDRVCLINSHLEPAHVATLKAACARVVTDGGSPVCFPDQMERRWARTLTEEFKRGACHAGRYETSLLLAARPELVRESRAALPPLAIDLARAMRAGVTDFVAAGAADAYFGDPAAATAEEGEAIYHLLVEIVLATVGELWPD